MTKKEKREKEEENKQTNKKICKKSQNRRRSSSREIECVGGRGVTPHPTPINKNKQAGKDKEEKKRKKNNRSDFSREEKKLVKGGGEMGRGERRRGGTLFDEEISPSPHHPPHPQHLSHTPPFDHPNHITKQKSPPPRSPFPQKNSSLERKPLFLSESRSPLFLYTPCLLPHPHSHHSSDPLPSPPTPPQFLHQI